ncbi:uncharacterized protein LOC108672531 isoform X2 [Hyalella azteca]|uniref:Uncharacterized protein LOC108672531 isoform X2 n=1 Tax=Hyalella azteca TaxID=294128 RepID=A0A8B7NPV2_HYAAZ|nr:uncharacterized protein LOC108672531 isoform X2 [Hyalella azteca]
MPRGRGRGTGKRGRPRTSEPAVSSPATDDEPKPKKRRAGRPPRVDDADNLPAKVELDDEPSEDFQEEENGPAKPRLSKRGRGGRRTSGRPRKSQLPPLSDDDYEEEEEEEVEVQEAGESSVTVPVLEEEQACGLHMSTVQVKALSHLVACKDCGESVSISVRPTTKGMISEFVVTCTVCESKKVTITPNLVRERKRKREVKNLVLQKTENINYAHVAAFLDNGLGYSGLRHYCKYFNARCLNEATFIVYARQVIQDVVNDTEDNLQSNARIVRRVYDAGVDEILDITVSFTTTYHQWGSDFCLVAGAVIELQTGLVLDYDVANMYCHVCKINAKRIISMTPTEMTEWFNKHQSSCEIREWCDELDHDAEEGVKDIEPKYLECFVAKKIWSRSVEKFGFRYSTLIHESDENIHSELLRAAPYGDTLVVIDHLTNCFSRRKSEHARTAFQNKLKSKCPRERVQTKDRIMYVYAMSIPEYNRFAVGSNIKLRELVRKMEMEEAETEGFTLQVLDTLPTIQAHEVIPADDEQSEVIYTQVTGDEHGGEMYTIEADVADQPEEEEDDPEEEMQDEIQNEDEDTDASLNSPAPLAAKKAPHEIKCEVESEAEIASPSKEIIEAQHEEDSYKNTESTKTKKSDSSSLKGVAVAVSEKSQSSDRSKSSVNVSGARTVVISSTSASKSGAPTQIIVLPAGSTALVKATTTGNETAVVSKDIKIASTSGSKSSNADIVKKVANGTEAETRKEVTAKTIPE